MIHRDLKPGNIFISGSCIKIGDFGLATLCKEKYTEKKDFESLSEKNFNKIFDQKIKGKKYQREIGTPLYISPEQKSSSNYDSKADIYSLGIILYEILSNFSTGHEKIKCIKRLRKSLKVDEKF